MKYAHYRGKWLAVWLAACLGAVPGARAADALRVVSLKSPAPEQSMTPFLTATQNGMWLSWLERVEGGHALKFSTWDGHGFGRPSTIHTSDRFFANWADFSSILSFGDGRLAAHWLEKAAENTYEYDVFIALSDDGGKSWSTPEKPHRDGTFSEHGFVSLVADDASGFSAVWLDGRQFEKGASDNEMNLRYTRFDGKAFTEDIVLDGRVCECCQTGMARTEVGLFVAYRDRSADETEIRDISYVRQIDGQWTEFKTLHEDGWEIQGCPVNGPQVAASGNRLAVAWFSGSSSEPKVQLLISEDGGAGFGKPIRIVVLKARKGGVSTLVQALFFFLCGHYKNQVCTMLAHVPDSTAEIFEIARFMAAEYAELPVEPPQPYQQKLVFPGQTSRYWCHTAAGAGVGAGGTPNALHLSEAEKGECHGIRISV